MELELIYKWLEWVWSFNGTRTIVFVTVLNVIAAYVRHVKDGDFLLTKTFNFLKELVGHVALYVFIKAVELYGGLDSSYGVMFTALSYAVWGWIQANLLGNIAEHLKALGLPVPDELLRLLK